MWFVFYPTGCFIHFCKTQGQEHSLSKSIYLATPHAFRLMEEGQAEVLQGRENWKAATLHYLGIVLLLLERDLSSAQVEVGNVNLPREAQHKVQLLTYPPHPALQRACRFIEDHMHDALRAPQIASAAGVSTSGLNQLFRKHLQTSVAHYVICRRIERASTLLRETNLAVSLVATQSGFANREHFSRTFHRAKGLSPLAYRRSHQKQNGL
jgi:AraC-like DNA-binding protein